VALVVDASALVMAVLGRSSSARDLRRRLATELCHAPHLIDAEVGNVLRRHVLRGELSPSAGQMLIDAAGSLIDQRYEMVGALARAAWLLRDNVSFYDALYAALAQALRCPLLTADQRLTRAPALPCVVELAPPT
jgi:predicted nucleic acid-binding protein